MCLVYIVNTSLCHSRRYYFCSFPLVYHSNYWRLLPEMYLLFCLSWITYYRICQLCTKWWIKETVKSSIRRLHGFFDPPFSRANRGGHLLINGWFLQSHIEESIWFALLPRDLNDQPIINKGPPLFLLNGGSTKTLKSSNIYCNVVYG